MIGIRRRHPGGDAATDHRCRRQAHERFDVVARLAHDEGARIECEQASVRLDRPWRVDRFLRATRQGLHDVVQRQCHPANLHIFRERLRSPRVPGAGCAAEPCARHAAADATPVALDKRSRLVADLWFGLTRRRPQCRGCRRLDSIERSLLCRLEAAPGSGRRLNRQVTSTVAWRSLSSVIGNSRMRLPVAL